MNLKVSIGILYTSMRAYMGMYVACVADGKYKYASKDTRVQDARPASRTQWRSRKLDVWRECWLCVFIKVQRISTVTCLCSIHYIQHNTACMADQPSRISSYCNSVTAHALRALKL